MRTILPALVTVFFLTACGGGGSNSGAGAQLKYSDMVGRYEGTLGSDVRITLTISLYNEVLQPPIRGRYRIRKSDNGCAFEGNWNAWPDTGSIGINTYIGERNVWSGQNLNFDGSSLKSDQGRDNRHAAYSSQLLRDCSPRITGAVNLKKVN